MAEDVGDGGSGGGPPPIRLMNFVSQDQLEEAKRNRGERLEDGTAQRDRPLFEVLKENKDKRDAEFNERFKHRPPKALDEDETDFLDNLDLSRKEYERQIADEEAQQLRTFQAAVEAQFLAVQEVKETPLVSNVQDPKRVGKKNQPARPLGMIIKVKPQAKKAKVDSSPELRRGPNVKHLEVSETEGNREKIHDVTKFGLVSYSDESDGD